MSIPMPTRQTHALIDGIGWNLLAEGLAVPTGVLTAAFLGRMLGPSAYGLFALAASLMAVLEWMLAALFARAVLKLTATSNDWQPIGATAARLSLAFGAAIGGLVAATAGSLAAWLGEPELVTYLRLFAVELPLFGLFAASRNIQAGRGLFRLRALAGAARWTARLALMATFVGAGLSIPGAIAGSIGAVIVGCAAAQAGLRLPWWRLPGAPAREVWMLALPLFALALSLRVFEKLGLFVLKGLGATAADAGLYAAAQNLAAAPTLVAQAATPLVLSGLTLALQDRRRDDARQFAAWTFGLSLWLIPFAAFVAGASDEVMAFVYGPAFVAGANAASMLMLASVGTVVVAVATSMLIAAERVRLALALATPLCAAAWAGFLMIVPGHGGAGAAFITMLVALAGAVAAGLAALRVWRVSIDPVTVAATMTAAAGAYGFAVVWETHGVLLLVKSGVVCVLIAALLLRIEFGRLYGRAPRAAPGP